MFAYFRSNMPQRSHVLSETRRAWNLRGSLAIFPRVQDRALIRGKSILHKNWRWKSIDNDNTCSFRSGRPPPRTLSMAFVCFSRVVFFAGTFFHKIKIYSPCGCFRSALFYRGWKLGERKKHRQTQVHELINFKNENKLLQDLPHSCCW